MKPLSPLVKSFVSHFGEMGSRWGINRTVGQIYALIVAYVAVLKYMAEKPEEVLHHAPDVPPLTPTEASA